MNRLFIIAILLIFGVLVAISGCHKLCSPSHYVFNADGCILQPNKDSIHIGDTLFFTSSTPTLMINLGDGKKIDYSSAVNFGSDLGVAELTGVNTAGDAVSYFSYVPQKGEIYTDPKLSPGRVKQLKYVIQNGSYELSFAIVPNKKGIFGISIADMPDVVADCARSSISLKFSSNINNHLHYLKDIYYGGGQINALDSTHTYCFKVY